MNWKIIIVCLSISILTACQTQSKNSSQTVIPPVTNATKTTSELTDPLSPPIKESADQVANAILQSYKIDLRPTVTVSGSLFSVSNGLVDAYRLAIQNYPTKLFEDYGIIEENYEVKSINIEKNWADVSIGPKGIPANIQKERQAGKLTEWEPPLHSAIAYQLPSGQWVAALYDTIEFNELALLSPNWSYMAVQK